MAEMNFEKRPVILTVIGSLGDGGKERQLIIHLKSLQERKDFSTILVVMNPDGLRQDEAASVADVFLKFQRKRYLNVVSALKDLVKIIKEYDVKLIHSWGSGIWDLISLIAAKWCRIPLLHNGIQSSPTKLSFSDQLTRFSAIFADVIVANSNAGLSAFKLNKHPKAQVIYNGMDPERFAPYSEIKSEDNLCMVANFRVEKDHQTMIQALDCIRESIPTIHVILVGHDFGTLTETQNLVKTLKLHDHVTFVTDTLYPEPYIAKSSVCILATHGEGISNVLLEYMALKKPIIVSNNGGNPEVVIDGVNGFLVKPGSVEELCKKALTLHHNHELSQKMGFEGRKIFEEKFSIPQMESAFNEVYQKLLQ